MAAYYVRLRKKGKPTPPPKIPGFLGKLEMGAILHSCLPQLGRTTFWDSYWGCHHNYRQLTPSHLPVNERHSVAACLAYVQEMISLADSYTFEPIMDGYVPDLEMHHRSRGYIIEIKTVWRENKLKDITKEFGKGQRQVQHGVSVLRQRTRDRMEIYGCVLAFVIYADGSEPEVIWKDVVHYVPSPSA